MKRPILPLFLSLCLGICISHTSRINLLFFILPTIFLALALIFLPLSRKKRSSLVLLIFFCLGGILYRNSNFQKKDMLSPYLRKDYVSLEGTVLEPPYKRGNAVRFRCRIYDQDVLAVVFNTKDISLLPSDHIRFLCRLKKIKGFKNPGSFNYKAYMERIGIRYKAYISDPRYIVYMGKGRLPFPYNIEELLKLPIRRFFKKELSERDFQILSAIILGERKGLDPEIKEMINRAGLGHILAVSGLHIGLIAWISFMAVRWLILRSYRLTLSFDPEKLSSAITIFPVLLYCLISGLRLPTQRAMIMILIYLISIIFEKQDDIISSLCLAGAIILSIHPESIFSPSFQLSFISVTGIILLMSHIKAAIRRFFKREGLFFDYIIDLISVTLSALIILLPILLYYFYRLPLFSMPSNITVIPILGLWVLPFSFASILFLPLSAKLSSLILHISTIGLHLMLELIRFWSNIPFSSILLFKTTIFEVFIYYAFVCILVILKEKRTKRYGMILLSFLILFDAGFWIYKTRLYEGLRITLLDTGRGNSCLVELPHGKRILICNLQKRPYIIDMVVIPFLCYSRIGKIDYVISKFPEDSRKIEEIFHARRVNEIMENIGGARVSYKKKDVLISYGKRLISIRTKRPEVHIRSGKRKLSIKREDGAIQIVIGKEIQIRRYGDD